MFLLFFDAPTADVVPKSEVASEVAREIFGEIERYIQRYWHGEHYGMYEMEKEVAELKKKYTEDKE